MIELNSGDVTSRHFLLQTRRSRSGLTTWVAHHCLRVVYVAAAHVFSFGIARGGCLSIPPPQLTRDSVTSSDRCKLQNRRETKQFHYHLTVVAKFTDFVKRNFTLTMADINLMYTTNTSNSVRLVNFSNQQTSHEVGAVCKTFDGFSTLQPPIALE